MSKSDVFFIEVDNSKDVELVKSKLKLIIKGSKVLDDIKKDDFTAIKLTFGEKGNAGFINPKIIKALVDKVKSKAGLAFLTDTNVLYEGKRNKAVEHLMLAYEHGFDISTVGVPIIIADGLLSENVTRFDVKNQKNIKYISAPTFLPRLDYIIGVAHITGHIMSGFGGAIKNIAMGFSGRSGKQIQHSSVKPQIISEKCKACGLCVERCPTEAIAIKDKTAYIDFKKCLGCAECIPVCKFNAIKIQWDEDMDIFLERMTEYCYCILSKIPKKVFINFATHITSQCDCLAKDDPAITPDLGIFFSRDALAVDKAAYDMVFEKEGSDIFKRSHPGTNFTYQLEYGSKIGLGNLDYNLINI